MYDNLDPGDPDDNPMFEDAVGTEVPARFKGEGGLVNMPKGDKIDPYTFEVIETGGGDRYTDTKPTQSQQTDTDMADDTTRQKAALVAGVFLQTGEEEAIINALSAARLHADRVCKRDHIKADRIERVNQFVTSLRRELGYISRQVQDRIFRELQSTLIYTKEVWYDICTLSSDSKRYTPGGIIPQTMIDGWVHAAKMRRADDKSVKYEIEGEIEDLEQELVGLKSMARDAERIASEGEQLNRDLMALLFPQEMSDGRADRKYQTT